MTLVCASLFALLFFLILVSNCGRVRVCVCVCVKVAGIIMKRAPVLGVVVSFSTNYVLCALLFVCGFVACNCVPWLCSHKVMPFFCMPHFGVSCIHAHVTFRVLVLHQWHCIASIQQWYVVAISRFGIPATMRAHEKYIAHRDKMFR